MKIDPTGPHFAIEVADLAEARRQLAEAGVEVLDPGADQLWVLDPDGYTVEITQARRA
jgi:catechol 2,3-dioxygenase-like lactoylglutathione lyase family enzyme